MFYVLGISSLFEYAVGEKLSNTFSLSGPSYVKANLEQIEWQEKIIYDNRTGGEIDCLAFIPEKGKLLVLELKNKSMPTSLRMLKAQEKRFVENTKVSEQLEKKIKGLREAIELSNGEAIKSIFPSVNHSININRIDIVGAIVTSFVSTEKNDKFLVVSVSDISNLNKLIN